MDKKDEQKKPDSKSTKTDPQEHMEGPISSIVQNIKESAEENDQEDKETADKKKEKNT